MKLLTKEIKNKMYKNMETEELELSPSEIKVPLKLFTPFSNWTWYGYELMDEIDNWVYGYVVGFECENGPFSLNELRSYIKFGMPMVERDKHWNPNTTLQQVYDLTK